MKVLDLCCGGGAASDGYARAGYTVVGVDIDPQPSYPYQFVRADALAYLANVRPGEFDLIHASPPCQGYSTAVVSRSSRWVPTRGKDEPRLIAPIREELLRLGTPWVIENVVGAAPDMRDPFLLCGVMFGLSISRHRLFEASFAIEVPAHPACRGVAKAYATSHGIDYRDMSVTGKGRHAGWSEQAATLLDMHRVMRQHDYSEAIPPAYTFWVGTAAARIAEAQRMGWERPLPMPWKETTR